jgi:hypothetical protein
VKEYGNLSIRQNNDWKALKFQLNRIFENHYRLALCCSRLLTIDRELASLSLTILEQQGRIQTNSIHCTHYFRLFFLLSFKSEGQILTGSNMSSLTYVLPVSRKLLNNLAGVLRFSHSH